MGTVSYTVFDGEITSEYRNGVLKTYVVDPLGSTIALIDNTQTITDTFSYSAFGEVVNHVGGTPTPFQYVGSKGYYRDSATRTHVRARNFYVNLGKWSTQDPIWFDGGDRNLYRYCENNPIILMDASGLMPQCTCNPNVLSGIGKKHPQYKCYSNACLYYCRTMDNIALFASKMCNGEKGTKESFGVGFIKCYQINEGYPVCKHDEAWVECGKRLTEFPPYANKSNWPTPLPQIRIVPWPFSAFGGEYCCVECAMRVCCATMSLRDPASQLAVAFRRCGKNRNKAD